MHWKEQIDANQVDVAGTAPPVEGCIANGPKVADESAMSARVDSVRFLWTRQPSISIDKYTVLR